MSPERQYRYHASFEQIASSAKEIALRDGFHAPILIVEGTRNFQIHEFKAMPETHRAREQFMDLMGRTTAKLGRIGQLRQVFFICEGWMSMAKNKQPPKIPPSEDPDRIEVLVLSGLEIVGSKKHLKLFQMLRDEKSQLVELREIQPLEEKAREVDVPLLDAFVKGFQSTYLERVN